MIYSHICDRNQKKDIIMNTPSVAVLLPCYNEGPVIASVVHAFREALPNAIIYVYDNNSDDETAVNAVDAGAVVRMEPNQGKGNVMRRMFSDIEADFYVLADGDGTYAASDVSLLLDPAVTQGLDMVVGRRQDVTVDAGRSGHALGNRLFNFVFRQMFKDGFEDIFSGYRVFSRRFVKSFPALSTGFEIETELSVHALMLKQPIAEIEVSYGRRIEGSESKLSTFGDGWKILKTFVLLMKEARPFAFFNYLAVLALIASVVFGFPVLVEYFQNGFVTMIPRWILSVGLLSVALMMVVCGLILGSVARGRAEQIRMAYLRIPIFRVKG